METDFVIWLQTKGAVLHWPMRVASELGPSTTFGVLLAGLYWCWDYSIMCRVWLANILGMWVTSVLKVACHTPRPYWIEPDIQGLTRASGFGMPSGHALVSTAVWARMACLIRRTWMSWACGLIVLAVGVSRIYLGVHSVAQVFVGILLGLGVVVLLPKLEQRLIQRCSSWSLVRKLAVILGVSLTACVLAWCVREFSARWPLPPSWVEMALAKRPQDGAIHPFSLHSAILSAATFAGFLGGYLILIHQKQDCRPRGWRARAWRVLVGGGIVGPYVYLTRRLLRGEALLDYPFAVVVSADYLYGFGTGLLISLIVPLVYNRLRI